MKIHSLYIYPVKSLGGIAVDQANIKERGFEFDRRYMLVNHEGIFQTQRQNTTLAHLIPFMEDEALWIRDRRDGSTIKVPKETTDKVMDVKVWDDIVSARLVSEEIDKWLSDKLEMDIRMVFMGRDSHRLVDEKYTPKPMETSFSDGFPYLIIGQASLTDLNEKINGEQPIEMRRFRPNIVVDTETPFEEHGWKSITINGLSFEVAKPCARCVFTTIDPETAEKGKEPLQTLAKYRRTGNKIMFGENALALENGTIKVGDKVEVLSTKEPFM